MRQEFLSAFFSDVFQASKTEHGTQWIISDSLSGRQLPGSKAPNLAIGPCSFSPRVPEFKMGLKEDGHEWDAHGEPRVQQRRSFLYPLFLEPHSQAIRTKVKTD